MSLVGGLVALNFYCSRNIGNLIITDELIFFRAVAQPPTSGNMFFTFKLGPSYALAVILFCNDGSSIQMGAFKLGWLRNPWFSLWTCESWGSAATPRLVEVWTLKRWRHNDFTAESALRTGLAGGDTSCGVIQDA